jgi:hypothetical protein
MTEEIRYPERQFKIGNISCAIWRTQENKNGRTKDRFSIKVQKSLKDPATGKWRNSEIFLFPSEILPLLTVAQKAYEHCMLSEKSEEEDESVS